MRLYSNESIQEGQYAPKAWIWYGNIIPLSPRGPIGTVFRVIFPWYTRQKVFVGFREQRECTCQPAFEMSHFEGEGPEQYRWYWIPTEELQ